MKEREPILHGIDSDNDATLLLVDADINGVGTANGIVEMPFAQRLL